ncbi:MAG: endolytic transglycosylase MltG [Clostridia bacterium]|nr:endolytic transglycosylase MltG [Clostridia bacterium]
MHTNDQPAVTNKGRIKWIWSALLVLFVLGCYQIVAGYLKPYSVHPVRVEVEIPLGSNANTIANILAEKQLIRHPKVFYYYTRIKGISQDLKAGTYVLDASWSLDKIASTLTKGGRAETVRLTVPEGLKLEQIAQRIEDAGLASKEEFLEAAGREYNFDFLAEIPKGPKYLEGFLFPDTYEVRADATPDEIIAMMLRRFGQVYSDEYRERQRELGLSTFEVVTMASIIEREAKLDEERTTIAAVFHNRLQKKMLLQSCATVQYLLDEPKVDLTTKDLEIDSPYNTYKYQGLPPGPIASPGKASLEAALYPADVDYLYFRVDPERDGAHIFSRTFAEHSMVGR